MNRSVPPLFLIAPLFFLSFFTFLPTAHAAWYDSNYQYCIPLTTTAGGDVGGVATTTTTGFALVATSTISTLAATSSSGHIYETGTNAHGTTTPVDVVLTNGTDCNSDGGSPLDFYFEKYVPATGEFALWVEPDNISSTTAKTVLMYYGYADNSATDQSDEAGVFGGLSEVSAWNLSEDPGTAGAGGIKDSLGTNDGTDGGGLVSGDQVSSLEGGGLQFSAGSNDVIDVGTFSVTTRITMAAWVYYQVDPSLSSKDDRFLSKADGTGQANHDFMIGETGGNLRMRAARNSGTLVGSSAFPVGQWTYVVGWYTADLGAKLYFNGAFETSGSLGINLSLDANSDAVYIGNQPTSANSAPGAIMDDVRIFNRILDDMDVLTIYNNTKSSTIFWTFGDEETEDAGATPARVIRLFGGVRLLGGVRLR